MTDGMKRGLRTFGVQFGNGFYGDQPTQEAKGRRTAAGQRDVRPGTGQSMRQDLTSAAAEAARELMSPTRCNRRHPRGHAHGRSEHAQRV